MPTETSHPQRLCGGPCRIGPRHLAGLPGSFLAFRSTAGMFEPWPRAVVEKKIRLLLSFGFSSGGGRHDPSGEVRHGHSDDGFGVGRRH